VFVQLGWPFLYFCHEKERSWLAWSSLVDLRLDQPNQIYEGELFF
jgi:hypothetical protein